MSAGPEVIEEPEELQGSSGEALLERLQQGSGEQEEEDVDFRPPARMREMMAMFGSFGPAPSPLAEKVTTEHIDKMLDLERRKLDHMHKDRADERRTSIAFGSLTVFFVLVLVAMLLFTGNAALLPAIISGLIGLVAGALGGYGFGKSRG